MDGPEVGTLPAEVHEALPAQRLAVPGAPVATEVTTAEGGGVIKPPEVKELPLPAPEVDADGVEMCETFPAQRPAVPGVHEVTEVTTAQEGEVDKPPEVRRLPLPPERPWCLGKTEVKPEVEAEDI